MAAGEPRRSIRQRLAMWELGLRCWHKITISITPPTVQHPCCKQRPSGSP